MPAVAGEAGNVAGAVVVRRAARTGGKSAKLGSWAQPLAGPQSQFPEAASATQGNEIAPVTNRTIRAQHFVPSDVAMNSERANHAPLVGGVELCFVKQS